MSDAKFNVVVDTNVLMQPEFNFEDYGNVYISLVVLEELDKHKSGEGEKAYRSREAIRKIKRSDNVLFITPDTTSRLSVGTFSREEKMMEAFDKSKNDNLILRDAFRTIEDSKEIKDIKFLTYDVNLLIKAQMVGLPVLIYAEDKKRDGLYKGYREVYLTEEEQAEFYQTRENKWDLLHNEYLIIRDVDGNFIDKVKWSDGKFVQVVAKDFNSIKLGKFKPRDEYQMIAMDAIDKSDFTIFTGAAGTAKSLISLSWIAQALQNGKYGKCVIVYAPQPLRGNQQIGYLPGSKDEKLLASGLGGILASKFGDMMTVEHMVAKGELLLVPSCDIRGIEVGDGDILYVTEAQNTDIYTMKTIIQRAAEGAKIIIEGDVLEQSDLRNVGLKENGLYRAIEVFKGRPMFSCVKLKKIYRSPIAEIAQEM